MGKRPERGSSTKKVNGVDDTQAETMHWQRFSVGCVLLFSALGFAAWGFSGPVTEARRQILLWILPLASGFGAFTFVGSMTAKVRGTAPGMLVTASSGFAVWLLSYFLLPVTAFTSRNVSIVLTHASAPLIEKFHVTVQIPPYQPIEDEGKGSVSVAIPAQVEELYSVTITCPGYTQESHGPFPVGSGVVSISMRRATQEPAQSLNDAMATVHLPQEKLLLMNPPIDPSNVVFSYRNGTTKTLTLHIFSGWRYAQRKSLPNEGTVSQLGASPWSRFEMPAQGVYQKYSFSGETGNGWCCFFVTEAGNPTPEFLGCHNFFADENPKLDIETATTGNRRFSATFTPLETFGASP